MKFTVQKPTEIDIEYVEITIPLRYDDDGGMSQDFPLRNGSKWCVGIRLKTGRIIEWPANTTGEFHVYEKVCDAGVYELFDAQNKSAAKIDDAYVPSLIPNDWGDYVDLKITNGVVTNWRTPTDEMIAEFFGGET